MDKTTILLIIEAISLIVAFVISKYVPSDKIEVLQGGADQVIGIMEEITKWAVFFVHYARQHLKEMSGSEKMQYVVSQLAEILKQKGDEMTEEQITAIAQTAYDEMINNESNIKESK